MHPENLYIQVINILQLTLELRSFLPRLDIQYARSGLLSYAGKRRIRVSDVGLVTIIYRGTPFLIKLQFQIRKTDVETILQIFNGFAIADI
jgi:hypothetical protein